MLERPDDTYEERLSDDLGLPFPPPYFKRQIHATSQKDFHGVRGIAAIASTTSCGTRTTRIVALLPEGHRRPVPRPRRSARTAPLSVVGGLRLTRHLLRHSGFHVSRDDTCTARSPRPSLRAIASSTPADAARAKWGGADQLSARWA